ncbi:hypothetical protein M902_1757 [Bacteriovorax sp. BAL6_X]|nr:hypothetical protein M902_1757 [Bacteriovorax sp. BAL6_X]
MKKIEVIIVSLFITISIFCEIFGYRGNIYPFFSWNLFSVSRDK